MPPTNYNQEKSYAYSNQPAQKTGFLRSKLFKVVIVLLILLFLVVLVTKLTAGKGPAGVASTFVNDALSNQPTSAYNLTSTNFEKSTNEAELASDFQSVAASCSGSPILSSSTVNASTAKYIYITYNPTCHLEVELSKTSGTWSVDFFNQY